MLPLCLQWRCRHSTTINTWRLSQNCSHFAADYFKYIFFNENVWIPIQIALKFVSMRSISNIPAWVQIMAWRRPGDKPLSETIMVRLPTHLCVTRLRWVNASVRIVLSADSSTFPKNLGSFGCAVADRSAWFKILAVLRYCAKLEGFKCISDIPLPGRSTSSATWTRIMATKFDSIVTTITKPPALRTDAELEMMLPWLRKNTSLFANLARGELELLTTYYTLTNKITRWAKKLVINTMNPCTMVIPLLLNTEIVSSEFIVEAILMAIADHMQRFGQWIFYIVSKIRRHVNKKKEKFQIVSES